MKPIIEIQNLWKSYQIGKERQRYLSLRDSISNLFLHGKKRNEQFWALKNICLDISPGESIGIIGRNGAGKSTLLKILSRITPPTKGLIKIRGRLASLLEVGTGFHPELTGRENIYLNGSILGLRKKNIDRQFDEIVHFSGVEYFLDTPLKRYSTGMQLRLAFAVAAHLDSGILIIDEILAVGDSEFQKKCLGKMDEVSKSGRTVLFVSHNLSAVRQLCSKGILIEKGASVVQGPIDEVINCYRNLSENNKSEKSRWENSSKHKKPKVLLKNIEIRNKEGQLCSSFLNSEDIYIYFHVHAFSSLQNLTIGFDLVKSNLIVCRSRQVDSLNADKLNIGEQHTFMCCIPGWLLNAGQYFICPLISIHCIENILDEYDIGLSFEVNIDASRSPYHTILNPQNHPGAVFPTFKWSIQ